IRNLEEYINPERLDEYEYFYEDNSSFQGRPMIVISFKSRGKVSSSQAFQRGHQSGRLYFDLETDALASVVLDHEMVVPGALKPVLFLMGYSISNPKIKCHINYQFFEGKWYPQSTRFDMTMRMVDKHLFSKNEVSNLDLNMLVVFSNWEVEQAQEIPEDKRMTYSKKFEEQVYPIANITWETINRIPFE
ncbi:MAG: hypothetical protein HRT74_06290, partial [Flavobacteriales bacterium]|nr:hypothetical protein [Flavobacteriales bacterium]